MGITTLPAILKRLAGPKRRLRSLCPANPAGALSVRPVQETVAPPNHPHRTRRATQRQQQATAAERPAQPPEKTVVVGVDMSCILMALVKTPRGAEEYHQMPPHPAQHVAQEALKYIRNMKKHGMIVIPVFDGNTRTHLKARKAGRVRDKSLDKSLEKLRGCLAVPWPATEKEQQEQLKNIAKHRKGSARVSAGVRAEVMRCFRENGIEYIVAPFEADWQLAYMYRIGLINLIDTTDSDYWALIDGPGLALDQNRGNQHAFLCMGNNCELRGENEETIESRGNAEGVFYVDRAGAILRAAIFGNDYVKGVHGEGVKFWKEALELHGSNLEGMAEHYTKHYPQFAASYALLNNVYHHAPVFEMEKVNDSERQWSLTGRMVSLSGHDFSPERWEATVGFDPHEFLYSKWDGDVSTRPAYTAIGEGEWFAAEGVSYEASLVQRKKNAKGEELPYGHDLDFVACPTCYQPKESLERWINVRGQQRRKRYDIVRVVNRMRKQNLPILSEEEAQIFLPKNVRYSGLEVLVPSVGACVWEKIDLSILRKARSSDKYINAIFGRHNGVRRRALKRVKNGHYFIDTLQSAEARSIATPKRESRKLFIISCEVLASQRKNVYRVHLVINEDGEYVKAPFSRCSCPAGSLFCAHMLGLLIICNMARKRPRWDRLTLAKRLPCHALLIQRKIIPASIFISRRRRKKRNSSN